MLGDAGIEALQPGSAVVQAVAAVVQRRGYASASSAVTAQVTRSDAASFEVTPSKRKRRGGGGAARGEVTMRRWLWLYAKLCGTLPPPLPMAEAVSWLPPVSAKATLSGEQTGGPKEWGGAGDVIVLVDGDNSGNILKHVEKFVAAGARVSHRKGLSRPGGARHAHAFVSRHYDGKCPRSISLHHATTGLPDAADHEITFFAGMSVPQITFFCPYPPPQALRFRFGGNTHI